MATVVMSLVGVARESGVRKTLHGSTRVLADKTTQLKALD